jgi:glycosyltransferase involved in cell wall biosynthesis
MDDVMNVLILAEASNAHTQRWARALVRRGWGVTVLSEKHAPINGAEVIAARVPGFGFRCPYRWWKRYARYLRTVIRHAQADLVHVHYLTDYALMPAEPDDPPVVISAWGSDVVPFETDAPDRPDQRRRKVGLLRGAAAVTATTNYLADRTAEFGAIPRESITVIPFGVELTRFKPARDKPPGAAPVVGFVKHIEARYGIQHLIEAVPAVLGRFPTVRFVIVGDGPMKDVLAERVRALGVEQAVEWRGRIPNEAVPSLLADMDVFVMPSVAEAFGVSAVEAQAVGVPVVFSDLPGIREAVIDGVGGLAVPPADPAALAKAICRLLADESLRRRLGQGGRQTVCERFDLDENVVRMETVYHRVLKRKACAVV